MQSSGRGSGTAARPLTERPLYKMSVQLIDTYKLINKVYYEKKLRRKQQLSPRGHAMQADDVHGGGTHNANEVTSTRVHPAATTDDGTTATSGNASQQAKSQKNEWDDENHDYVVRVSDAFGENYVIEERIGKGSFGQVVRARDTRTNGEVAIKIIKSKKPFALQARTEIELLEALKAADRDDANNLVRLLEHFVFRGHQCLVFELLSYNLYELLKNTQFHGVSLNLVRKFAKQILHSLAFLARPDVAIIHCDLKPENILLRHPKRSAIKVIDFGSSCRADRRMYSYIQSRFYRSPEVMLGLPYTVAIDVWSLGCILVEMHTGEPLFSGADQLDQMRKLVDVLGMPPDSMIEAADSTCRDQFFAKQGRTWTLRRRPDATSHAASSSSSSQQQPQQPSQQQQRSNVVAETRAAAAARAAYQQSAEGDEKPTPTNAHHHRGSAPASSAADGHHRDEADEHPQTSHRTSGVASIVGSTIGGPGGRRRGEPGHAEQNYDLFLDLVHRMLEYSPTARIKPDDALRHSFLNDSVWASTHVLDNAATAAARGTLRSGGGYAAAAAAAATHGSSNAPAPYAAAAARKAPALSGGGGVQQHPLPPPPTQVLPTSSTEHPQRRRPTKKDEAMRWESEAVVEQRRRQPVHNRRPAENEEVNSGAPNKRHHYQLRDRNPELHGVGGGHRVAPAVGVIGGGGHTRLPYAAVVTDALNVAG